MRKEEIRTFWKKTIGINDARVLKQLEKYSEVWELDRGEKVITIGEKITEVPFLVSGALKAVQVDENGKQRVICFGYMPGEVGLSLNKMESGMLSESNVEVVQKCKLISVPLDVLLELFQNSKEVMEIYTKRMSEAIQNLVEHEKILLLYKANERYEWFLQRYGELENKVRKQDIASYLGISPETLSRLLKARL